MAEWSDPVGSVGERVLNVWADRGNRYNDMEFIRNCTWSRRRRPVIQSVRNGSTLFHPPCSVRFLCLVTIWIRWSPMVLGHGCSKHERTDTLLRHTLCEDGEDEAEAPERRQTNRLQYFHGTQWYESPPSLFNTDFAGGRAFIHPDTFVRKRSRKVADKRAELVVQKFTLSKRRKCFYLIKRIMMTRYFNSPAAITLGLSDSL